MGEEEAMRARLPSWSVATWAAVLTSAATLAVWAWQIGTRVSFALDLEWMESGALHQAHRILQGVSAYPEPSSRFVPHLYTPGYSYLLAALGSIFALDFALARAISLSAVLASFVAIYKIVQREGRSALAGWLGIALFASSFRFCYRWMDLARADALMVALVLWGLYFLRSGWGHLRNVLLAGILMSAAYWVKQSAFTIIVGSGVAALWVAPRLLWVYVLSIGLLGGVGTWVYNQQSEGWFWYYIFELHQSHRFNVVRLRQKSWAMILHSWPLALAMLGSWAWREGAPWLRAQRKLDRALERLALARQSAFSGPIYWCIMTLTMAAAGAVSYSTQWAEPNAFLPFCAALGALCAILMAQEGRARTRDQILLSGQLLLLLLVEPNYRPLQKEGLSGIFKSYPRWRPWLGVPNASEHERARALAAQWEALSLGEGLSDVWGVQHRGALLALQHPWWSLRVGGSEHVASMALNDLGSKEGRPVRDELAERIEALEFEAIWIEGRPPRWLAHAMGSNYGLAWKKMGEQRVLPMSGWMSKAGTAGEYKRFQRLYLATKAIPLDPGCQRVADFEDATAQGIERVRGSLPLAPRPRKVRDALEVIGGAGQYVWSSGGRSRPLRDQGEVLLTLPSRSEGARLHFALGWIGEKKGISVRIESAGTGQDLSLPKRAGEMKRMWFALPSGRGAWSLRVVDESDKSALLLDEVWICDP